VEETSLKGYRVRISSLTAVRRQRVHRPALRIEAYLNSYLGRVRIAAVHSLKDIMNSMSGKQKKEKRDALFLQTHSLKAEAKGR